MPKKLNRKFIFYKDCTMFKQFEVPSLHEMIDNAKQITGKTFFKWVDRQEVYNLLGYDKSFPISKDNHVAYYSSRFKGKLCYFLVWSGIECIFLEQ